MHTGDLALLDGAGYCSIVGRIKDMVIRGGALPGSCCLAARHAPARACVCWAVRARSPAGVRARRRRLLGRAAAAADVRRLHGVDCEACARVRACCACGSAGRSPPERPASSSALSLLCSPARRREHLSAGGGGVPAPPPRGGRGAGEARTAAAAAVVGKPAAARTGRHLHARMSSLCCAAVRRPAPRPKE